MGMFTEWRDDAYAALQAKYAELEADYRRLLEGDDWIARCVRLENLHKDLVDEHRVTEEQLADARAEIERLNQSDYAYETIEEYENIVGYKVGEAFRLGWTMARTKISHLHAMAAEGESKDE